LRSNGRVQVRVIHARVDEEEKSEDVEHQMNKRPEHAPLDIIEEGYIRVFYAFLVVNWICKLSEANKVYYFV